MKMIVSSLEPLEARIAPALAFPNAFTATYTDVDGDLVTVKFSKPVVAAINASGGFGLVGQGSLPGGSQLQILNLTALTEVGLSVTITAKPHDVTGDGVPDGDGLVNLGYLNANNHDLGAVSIAGDVGRIVAGSGAGVAVKSLTVRSLGEYGLATGAPNIFSTILGSVGSLTVKGNVRHSFEATTIGNVTVGGSLIGGLADYTGGILSNGAIGKVNIGRDVLGGSGGSTGRLHAVGNIAAVTVGGSLIAGEIVSDADMGPVKIGHDVRGGARANTGVIRGNNNLNNVSIGGSFIGGSNDYNWIFTNGRIGMITIGHDMVGGSGFDSGFIKGGEIAGVRIGGSLIGGSNFYSGKIVAGKLGAVQIAHDLLGGSGFDSGRIESTGTLASVTIGGSMIGGSNPGAGEISSVGDLGPVKIGHDLRGGSITGTASLDSSGYIESLGRIASVTIGGSIISGSDGSTGTLTKNASIRAGKDIGALTVNGGLIGNVTPTGASLVTIFAHGQAVPTATKDLAIGKISIGGGVEQAWIFAGVDLNGTGDNGNAQIGAVKVGGDWIASSLGSGVTSTDGIIGDGNDAVIAGGTISRIASITIKGQVVGEPGTSHTFGFFAQTIGSFKYNGIAVALHSGASNDKFAGGAIGNAHPVGPTIGSGTPDAFAVHVFEV